MNYPRVLLAALVISSAFFSCDSDDPANPIGGNNNKGDLTISLTINRDQSWFPEALGGVEKGCNILADIKRNGEPVTDAEVVVNGTAVPFESMFMEQYWAEFDYSDFTPNQKIKCSITIDGQTAEEEVVLPGDITSSSDGSSVSWKYEGNGDFIYTQEIESEEKGTLSSTSAYESYDESSDLSSPASIPATAYPKTGAAYLQTTVVRNSVHSAFSSLSPKSAYIIAIDMVSVKIAR